MIKTLHLLGVIALGVLSACSGAEAPTTKITTSERQSFSAESKRIARRLSIGAEGSNVNGSPQDRAALCSLALEVIEDHLREGSVLSDEQQRAFAQARSLYKRRAAAGLSAEEWQKTMSDVEAAYPEQSDRARFAIGCLRDLA